MEIKSNQIATNELAQAQKKTTPSEVPVSAETEAVRESVYPDSATMRAYANIKPASDTVSKETVLDFIHDTGCKFEQRCQEFVKNVTDDDGYIKQETFDWLKQAYEDSKNLYLAVGIINNSKENGKINHKLLNVLTSVVKQAKSAGTYSTSMCYDIPRYLKDKNGKFNSDLIDIVKEKVEENPAIALRRPDYLVSSFKTGDGEFDTDAISYYKEQKTAGKPVKDIQNEIGYARDEAGKFSYGRLQVYQDLKSSGLEIWQIRKAQEIADTFTPEQSKEKAEFVEIAKTFREDSQLSEILDDIKEVKSSEDDKTGLGYNSESIEFVRDMIKISLGRQKKVPDVLKKINIPISEYTEENKKVLARLFSCWSREDSDIDNLIEAATYKAGDKKGQFSFDNLDKYIDIYTANMNDINTVKYVAGNLSLETDDYALGVITKLYNLSWERESHFGRTEDKLDRPTLSFIFDLCVLGHDGVPKRKAHRPALENIEKLMTMKLPMSSKEAFENFIFAPDFGEIDKLEKVRLDEIGIKTGQYTHGKFKTATEEELFAFKDYMIEYMKGKDPKYIDIDLNSNLKDVIEIKEKDGLSGTKITMYDIVKRKPTTEVHEQKGLRCVQRQQRNFENNIVTKQVFHIDKIKYADVERLTSQTTEKYDDNGNLLWTEEMKESDIHGVFNVTKKYPDGRTEDLVKAQKLPNGNDLVVKHLESFDGTKTEYYYEDDVNGNRIMDYKIISPEGKELMKKSVTFEVIDDNHFVSSRNDKKYDIKYNEKTIDITNLNTNETAQIDIENFTKSTQAKIIPLLKRIPGDELFMMKKLDLKNLSNDNSVDNAAYRGGKKDNPDDTGEILVSDNYLDDAVLLHEWGHGKDHIEFKEIAEEINKDKKLRQIYNKEKENFRANFSDAQLSHIAYFGADMHYLGSANAIQEGIAETNAILSVLPKNDVSAVRAHYWQQYFPQTIAYLSSLLH